jgi:hypothetical protein
MLPLSAALPLASEHGMDVRRLQRRARVDSADVGVRVWRAHNGRIELIGEPEIVKKATLPPNRGGLPAALLIARLQIRS